MSGDARITEVARNRTDTNAETRRQYDSARDRVRNALDTSGQDQASHTLPNRTVGMFINSFLSSLRRNLPCWGTEQDQIYSEEVALRTLPQQRAETAEPSQSGSPVLPRERTPAETYKPQGKALPPRGYGGGSSSSRVEAQAGRIQAQLAHRSSQQ
jgi:hypothetical protein